jgi:hypothetical protein
MGEIQNSVRIAAAYVLYLLYAPHHIDLNPFQSAISDLFTAEQSKLIRDLSGDTGETPHGNIQLAWTLWKVLRNQGADVS